MYLIRTKGTKKFKEISNISEFTLDMFETQELFSTSLITKEQFSEEVRKRKVADLAEQLKLLGIDLSAILAQQGVRPIVHPSNPTSPQLSLPVDINMTQQASIPPEAKLSRVKNPKTGAFYKLSDIQGFYNTFSNQVEKDIPEIEFSTFDERGIILNMVEPRPDLPKFLPNVGIPVIQIVSERIMR